jgi:hypothetical protein
MSGLESLGYRSLIHYRAPSHVYQEAAEGWAIEMHEVLIARARKISSNLRGTGG